jgi:uncharacterized membrane protein
MTNLTPHITTLLERRLNNLQTISNMYTICSRLQAIMALFVLIHSLLESPQLKATISPTYRPLVTMISDSLINRGMIVPTVSISPIMLMVLPLYVSKWVRLS